MDPSAAPWRVLESAVATAADGETDPAGGAPPERRLPVSPVTLAAIFGSVVLAVAAFVLASASTGQGAVMVNGGESLAPISGGTGSAQPGDTGALTEAAPDFVVVEIAGAVRRPGVFRLPVGSRVGDLIEAAGGYGPRLDAGRASRDLNLAARLADGDRVAVPSRDDVVASSTSGTGGSAAGGPTPGIGSSAGTAVDLNRATSAELDTLPGIGPVTAGKIITSREEQAFTSVDDLRTRKLVGAKTFDELKDLVSVR
jgi:DNA uptake protein and related DNA-binding proteins